MRPIQKINKEKPNSKSLGGSSSDQDDTADQPTNQTNTGLYNSGNRNTGCFNSGNFNAGNLNSGDRNTGCYDHGRLNTGDYNTGDMNSGDFNTGLYNSGHHNAGNCNSGNGNSGSFNSGDYNSGNFNTGCFNSGSFHVGAFNTTPAPRITLFDRDSYWTMEDLLESPAMQILRNMPANTVSWVRASDMSTAEKLAHPEYETLDGYLKVIPVTNERRQYWWDCELTPEERRTVMALPNFDHIKFRQCTGIKIVIIERAHKTRI